MDGWTWESLDREEEELAAEAMAEQAYQARQAARQLEEERWVDGVVEEQERRERERANARRKSSEQPPKSRIDRPKDWVEWEAAVAPFGLGIVASGAEGGGGRGLVARRLFACGEIVLSSQPIVFVVNQQSLKTCCHHCLARACRLLVCSRCGCARYCSVDHQRAAWEEHRDECALLSRTRPRVPGQTIRLLARLLSKLRRSVKDDSGVHSQPEAGDQVLRASRRGEEGANPPQVPAADAHRWAMSPSGISSLPHQLTAQPDLRVREFREQGAMLCSLIADVAGISSDPTAVAIADGTTSCLETAGHTEEKSNGQVLPARTGSKCSHGWAAAPLPGAQVVAEMISRLSLNCHTICDEELMELGVGLYPVAALANHSCIPNVTQSFGPNGQIFFRALAPIECGEEITISYIDIAGACAERHQVLKDTYLFECSCAACARASMCTPAAEAHERERAFMAAALREAQQAEHDALDREDWSVALAHARKGCELGEALLPHHNPSLGLQYLRASKLYAHLGDLQEAVACSRRALSILCVTHGDESSLVRKAQEMQRALQMELAYGVAPG